MSRYIDADKLAKRVLDVWKMLEEQGKDCSLLADIVTPLIVSTPTADVKPIVIEELEKIKAEIDVMYDSNNYTDEFEHGIMSVREIINKHISELRKESEAKE